MPDSTWVNSGISSSLPPHSLRPIGGRRPAGASGAAGFSRDAAVPAGCGLRARCNHMMTGQDAGYAGN